ncbi:hypothetical protein BASA81_010531 [Batrachochytrium salamandrivorans]|nr:hypothetical protein BASA81_010531 [Batrachochytrium salamandrivorans]
MELQQSDPVLEAFEKLRVREVRAYDYPSASAFLAKFQSSAASLEPDERIKLVVSTHESMEFLKAVLSDPQASKICFLRWHCSEEEDVNSVVSLLTNNCPELASLRVEFGNYYAFDFVSSMLEHPSNKLKVLEMPKYRGDSTRFFATLGQSQVSALTLSYSPKFAQGLFEYLARDLLVRLKVTTYFERVPPGMMMSLADCTRLAELEILGCEFSQPTAFTHVPKSVTKLELENCTFVGGFDWSFLADSNVRDLDFDGVSGVDGKRLGGALAVQSRAKGLDKLRLYHCYFVNGTLAAVGVELGRVKRLDSSHNELNDASVVQIALALKSPNSELRKLELEYEGDTERSIEDQLVPALKHPNCNLIKLHLVARREHKEAAKKVEDRFHNRRALFVLLQGRQVKRRYCPLRRLPVEMFRLVGMVLI